MKNVKINRLNLLLIEKGWRKEEYNSFFNEFRKDIEGEQNKLLVPSNYELHDINSRLKDTLIAISILEKMELNKILFGVYGEQLKMKNVKIKVETDEQNLKVQERVKNLNKEAGRTAWYVILYDGFEYYYGQVTDDNFRAVCSRWKKYKYLLIDVDSDLIICTSGDIWKKRKEKEVSFEEFMENR